MWVSSLCLGVFKMLSAGTIFYGRMIDESRIRKNLEGSCRGLTELSLRYLPEKGE
jgi:hypothetical protein